MLDAIHSCFDVRPTALGGNEQTQAWKDFWTRWKQTPYYDMSKVYTLIQQTYILNSHALF